jgi:YVTN family beta-propeller protein
MSAAGPGEVLVSATVRDLAAGSGLIFADRGVRELKGVPGEWHVFAVGLSEPNPTELAGFPTARERRAAAVRWSEARPIWQRHPRLTAAMAAALAVLLATSGLLVWRPWQPRALAGVTENSIGFIDTSRNEIIGEVTVGTRPAGIAVSDNSAWVTNTAADSVSQIDLATGTVVVRIDVGRGPKGIAVAEGSVWVANSGERTVSRINVVTGRVVDIVEVGNAPTAIAAAGSTLWVANATDSTVVSIDARSGDVGVPVGVAATPTALAVDEGGLWVVSEDGASVSHLDPVTGVTLAAPIQLSARPSAIALGGGSAWVASVDGTLTQIDRAANRVTATIDVGGSLSAIVISGNAIWVGDRDGNVSRLDADQASLPPRRISTSSAVASLAVINGDIWVAAQPSAASHRGGTLRIAVKPSNPPLEARFPTDPLADPFNNAALFVADGLVGYRRVGGAAGSALLPDLATSVPRPTNGGLTYTFHLRPNLEYSTGAPVRASDFRRAIERSFQVGPFGPYGPLVFGSIVGTEACVNDEQTPVERCDLSAGILTDDGADTVIFKLSAPDPDFVFKLANAAAFPVPEGVPMHEIVAGAFPGTGPYVVSEVSETEVRLARNPRFEVWDAAVRPDGYPGEIVFTVVEDDAQRIAMVEKGDADYVSFRGGNRTLLEKFSKRIKTQYPAQWHVGDNGTWFVSLNSSIPPFDNADARRAVNFAIDRDRIADVFGGPPDAAVTCQFLPPGWPGYQPYCPYTLDPDEGGRWKARDLEEAQRLVDASGTRGAQVVVGPTFGLLYDQLVYLGSVLEELGYQVTIDPESETFFETWLSGRTQITISGWLPDWVAPSTFLGLFRCGADPLIHFCDPEFDAAFDHALELQTTDPATALTEWAALDRRGVDLAVLAPLVNAGGDFVSARVGNYQFSLTGFVLFDQMWVQ